MAFEVGAIISKLSLDTKGWEASYAKVSSQADTLGNKIARNSDKIKKLGAAMTVAGTLITAGLGAMIKKTVEAGDWIDKMSKRTGISAESLSELAYAADLSGASLGDVERSVKRMAGSIVDASSGLETYARAFRMMGLEVDELMKMSPEQQFLSISEAIASIEDPTMRAALAQDVFGRAGTTLLPMMAEGVDGLRDLREQARATGFIFDKETAAKSAVLNDRMTELKTSFKGVTTTIAMTLIPAVTSIVEKIAGVIQGVSKWAKDNPILAGTIVKIVAGLGAMMAVLGPLLMILPKIAAGWGMVGTATRSAMGIIAIGVAAITALKTAFNALHAAQDRAMKGIIDAANSEKTAIDSVRKYREQASKEDEDRIERWIKMHRDQGIEFGKSMQMIQNHLRLLSPAYRDYESVAEKANKEVTDSTETATTDVVKIVVDGLDKITEAKRQQVEEWKGYEEEQANFLKERAQQDIERAGFMMEFYRQQENERRMIGLTGQAAELERLRQEEDAETQSVERRLGNTALFEDAKTQLADTYTLKRKEIIDKYQLAERNANKITFGNIASFVTQSMGIIDQLFNKGYENRMMQLNNEYEERKRWIEENVTDETEREKQLEALEDEFSKKKKDASRAAAIAAKASALLGAIVNTAQAVTKAYAQGGLFGIVSGSIMAALGAIQIAMIKSQPIPMAEGGVVTRPTNIIAGDNPSQIEAIVPLEKMSQFADQIQGAGGGRNINVTINTLDTKTMADWVRNNLFPYIQSGFKNEAILVPPNAVRSF